MTTFLAVGEQICKTAIWDRIQGWQVVLAVFIIAIVWGTVQVARMYFLAKAAQTCPHCTPIERKSDE